MPAANPITKGKYELGRQLYFDPRISLDGTVSCATCHNPAKGWTDGGPVSTGINGQTGNRNAPTVINTAYGKTMFWDGRAPSLEGQAQGPIRTRSRWASRSTSRSSIGCKPSRVQASSSRRSSAPMSRSTAWPRRSPRSSGSPPSRAILKYDKYNAGDNKALSESEKRGMVLFGLRLNTDDEFKPGVELQKAKCTLCHVGANFTDEQFHNLGIGWDEKARSSTTWAAGPRSPIGAKNDADLRRVQDADGPRDRELTARTCTTAA